MPARPSELRRALEQRISKTAKERGTTAARLRRLVGFAVVCETLSEAVARGVIPVFFVKGGVAIELRLGLLARATRDLDIGLCTPPNDLLPLVDAALGVGCGDFLLQRRGEARMLGNGVLALEVSIEYMGRPWGKLPIDLTPATAECDTDTVPQIELTELGLAPPRSVPCLAMPAQIAQKIHALTEPEPHNKPNPRARDVLDILVLTQRIDIERATVRAACEQVFAQRSTHPLPTSFEFPPQWHQVLGELAREIHYDTQKPSDIENRFNSYLAQLQGAPILPKYEYRFIALNYFITNSKVDSTMTSPVDESGIRYKHFQTFLDQGWRVHSIMDRAKGAGGSPELLVLLERPRDES